MIALFYAMGGAVTAVAAYIAWSLASGWVLISAFLTAFGGTLVCGVGLYLGDLGLPPAVPIIALGVLLLVDALGLYIVGTVAMRRAKRPLW